ncbi:tyrosine-protein phosphatase [Flavobacterium foetidum]|uniref:tyrosine-protein phosphatase n=1 Tax=Flavobacterium foetidum TaxID=2026681 RepID=UPI001075858E|nr:CpsB/CapC family capsule biosynthesis tyrosine phosphatase [Flavobacterium foetidum]KAF2517334.1 histidinol phosphatase [Flavobacterium foetidum]
MLSFFKSKPFLKDLLAGDYIDIHSHLLPGIDDGANSMAKSMQLVQSFQDLGISQIITTPHISHYVWNNSVATIISKLKETQLALEDNKIQIPIRTAAEYFMDDWFENHFKEEKLLTLKDNYVLVEMSYLNAPVQLYKILFEIQVAGYIPVLAHPERYIFYHKNFAEYEKLKKSGCLFQLNLLSTVGYYGDQVTKTAEQLLKKGMYDFAGTDIHHQNHIKSLNQKIKIESLPALKEIIANNEFFRF